MVRARYDDEDSIKEFRRYALKGGKGAFKALSWPRYVAFRRRFHKGKWKTQRRRGKSEVLPEHARPGRRPLYSVKQLERILERAKNLIAGPRNKRRTTVKAWHPVSKAPKHLSAVAREAFAEAAWRLRIRPAHLKAQRGPYTPSCYYLRKKVKGSSCKHVRRLWSKLVDAVKDNEITYRKYKHEGAL